MKNLETLINELCPEGVEFVKLVKYVTVQYGYPFDSKLFSEDEKFIPLIRIRDVLPAKPSTYYSGEYLKEYIVTKGDMLVGMDGNFNMEKWNDRDGLLNQRVCKIYTKDETILLDGFLYHYLRPLFKKIENSIQGSTVKHLSAKVINKIEIPLPPIEVQTEIVRILDKFTSLEAELEAELDCRKRQYEYYRDKLLSFENVGGQNVEWKKMSEVCKIMNGKDYKHLPNGDIPVYGSGGIMTHINEYAYNKPSVLIPRKGSIGNLFYVDEPFWTVDTIYWTKINENVIRPKFLYYFMTTKDLTKMNMAAGVPSLTQSMLNKIKLPIPPLAEQERIVSVLDRFESLTTSLTAGLPAEIAARRQQYEHYRDKLLTFKRKSA